MAAETIPKYSGIESPPEAFTAALLHDVGKTVMGRFLTPEILRSISFARAVDHLSQMEAEMQVLGVHDGELGGLIAQHWKMPPRVVQGNLYHHNPEQGMDVVCDITYLIRCRQAPRHQRRPTRQTSRHHRGSRRRGNQAQQRRLT